MYLENSDYILAKHLLTISPNIFSIITESYEHRSLLRFDCPGKVHCPKCVFNNYSIEEGDYCTLQDYDVLTKEQEEDLIKYFPEYFI